MQDVPYGYCHCGCGQRTTVPTKSSRSCGRVKGAPMRFVSGHNARRPIAGRFWNRVAIGTLSDCWLWLGSLGTQGYGQVSQDGRLVKAHRVAYELTNGPIPDGLVVHHWCAVKRCVNPEHLEAMTRSEHPDTGADLNRRKTRCPRGHAYDETNTYINPGTGGRHCRTCTSERLRAAARDGLGAWDCA